MRIINIGTQVTSAGQFEVTQSEILSDYNFLDAEIVFWDVEFSYTQLPGELKKKSTIPIRIFEETTASISNRRDEFDEFFEMGKTLIITTPSFIDRTYNLAHLEGGLSDGSINLIDCIPIDILKYKKTIGKNIEGCNIEFVQSFLNQYKYCLTYYGEILNSKGVPLMCIKGTKHVVAEYYKIKKGIIIVLPHFNIANSGETARNKFLASVQQLILAISAHNSVTQTPIPKLAEDYQIPGEKEKKDKLDALLLKKEELNSSISTQEILLKEYNLLKLMFTGDGSALEKIVGKIFTEIGFDLLPTDPDRADLIVKKGAKIGVVEIKGVKSSAAEKHAAQLEKWTSDYLLENNKRAKGILIVNSYKNQPIEDRVHADFPTQMLNFSTNREHCLISGIQLLVMYLDFKNNELTKSDFINTLFNTNGVLTYKKNVKKYFNKVSK